MSHLARTLLCLPLLLLLTADLAAQRRRQGRGADEFVRVLFVGNSYTFYHDMPWMIAALDKALHPERELVVARPVATKNDFVVTSRVRTNLSFQLHFGV